MSPKLALINRTNWQLNNNKTLAETFARDEKVGLERLTLWMSHSTCVFTYTEVESIVKQRYCEWKLEELLRV